MQTDAQLVLAARANDRRAFNALYDRYADRVHAFCFNRLRDANDAEDALRETFVAAHGQLQQLDDPSRFRPWLFSIARTTIIDLGRTRGRQDRRRDWGPVGGRRPGAELSGDDTTASANPRLEIGIDESAALLWEAAAGLRPRDQELLELHLREGLHGADLAQAMAAEPAQVNPMVTRMTTRLSSTVGAVLVALVGRTSCADLDALLEGRSGTPSLSRQTAISRHIKGCETCERTKRATNTWDVIATAMPSPPAPAAVRVAVADIAAGGILRQSETEADGPLVAVTTELAPPPTADLEPEPEPEPEPSADDNDAAGGDAPEEIAPAGKRRRFAFLPSFLTTASTYLLVAVVTAVAVIAWPVLRSMSDPDLVVTVAGEVESATPVDGDGNGADDGPTSDSGDDGVVSIATTSTTTTTTTIPLPTGPLFQGSTNPSVFPAGTPTLAYTFSNVGDEAMSWTAAAAAPFGVTASAGLLLPGQAMTLSVSFNVGLPPGDSRGILDLNTTGGDIDIDLVVTSPP